MASNFAEAMQQGYAFGAGQREDRERRSKLAELAGLSSKVISGDIGATDRAFALDPAAAKTYQSEGDRRQKQLADLASGWKKVPSTQRQAYYERFIAPAVSAMGFGDLGQYDETAVDGVADQILAAYGGGKAQNPYEGLPSDIQSLKLLQSDPTLAALDRERRQAAGMVPKLVETNQGIGWGTPGAGIDLAPINGVAGSEQQAPAQAPQLFAALGQKYGIQPTSVARTPERNRQVGGVANSYHLSGQAADWVVPQAQKAQFIQDARANGYEAIDEGDHIHIEPASRGGRAGIAGGVAQPYQAPQRPDIPAGFRLGPDGRSLEYIPGGPADPFVKNQEADRAAQAAAAKAAAEEAAKSGAERMKKAPQYQNVVRGLTRIDAALKALEGKFVDTGPIDQYLVSMSKEGQELRAAVGAIQNDMLALTRVPGVGSQSDLEAKIANLKYPDLSYDPQVNKNNLDQLRAFITDFGGGSSGVESRVRRKWNPATGSLE